VTRQQSWHPPGFVVARALEARPFHRQLNHLSEAGYSPNDRAEGERSGSPAAMPVPADDLQPLQRCRSFPEGDRSRF